MAPCGMAPRDMAPCGVLLCGVPFHEIPRNGMRCDWMRRRDAPFWDAAWRGLLATVAR